MPGSMRTVRPRSASFQYGVCRRHQRSISSVKIRNASAGVASTTTSACAAARVSIPPPSMCRFKTSSGPGRSQRDVVLERVELRLPLPAQRIEPAAELLHRLEPERVLAHAPVVLRPPLLDQAD